MSAASTDERIRDLAAQSKSDDKSIVGGKGANLGALAQRGFDVPPGYSVTTSAYTEFVDSNELTDEIAATLSAVDWDDPPQVERQSEDIRNLILGAPVPRDLADRIAADYDALGADAFVAVRSSGTAEDLADASFAGLHDTYLDVRGKAEVIDAVRRCWASMWTARALVYRQRNSFDHGEARLAVVVQIMVESEASGVMFTANPITTATDEVVVNASWGLGESVVSGAVTPDQFILQAETSRLVERVLGTKEIEIVRDPDRATGTITRPTDADKRTRYCLSDDDLRALARLGRDVQDFCGGTPQDIEWAIAHGKVHLLQSRPVTGVAFSWDRDIETDDPNPEIFDNEVWTREWADSIMTGGITPLTYSVRFAILMPPVWNAMATAAGLPELTRKRIFRYHKGELYYSSQWDRAFIEGTALPALRPMLLGMVPSSWHEDILSKPFSYTTYLAFLGRITLMHRKALQLNKWIDEFRSTQADGIRGRTPEQLRDLSDKEVERYIDQTMELETVVDIPVAFSLFVGMRDGFGLLFLLVEKW